MQTASIGKPWIFLAVIAIYESVGWESFLLYSISRGLHACYKFIDSYFRDVNFKTQKESRYSYVLHDEYFYQHFWRRVNVFPLSGHSISYNSLSPKTDEITVFTSLFNRGSALIIQQKACGSTLVTRLLNLSWILKITGTKNDVWFFNKLSWILKIAGYKDDVCSFNKLTRKAIGFKSLFGYYSG